MPARQALKSPRWNTKSAMPAPEILVPRSSAIVTVPASWSTAVTEVVSPLSRSEPEPSAAANWMICPIWKLNTAALSVNDSVVVVVLEIASWPSEPPWVR